MPIFAILLNFKTYSNVKENVSAINKKAKK